MHFQYRNIRRARIYAVIHRSLLHFGVDQSVVMHPGDVSVTPWLRSLARRRPPADCRTRGSGRVSAAGGTAVWPCSCAAQ